MPEGVKKPRRKKNRGGKNSEATYPRRSPHGNAPSPKGLTQGHVFLYTDEENWDGDLHRFARYTTHHIRHAAVENSFADVGM